MYGPPINVPAFDASPAAIEARRVPTGFTKHVSTHVELFPIQVEPFGTNEVVVKIDGVARLVDGFALTRAINEAITRFRQISG